MGKRRFQRILPAALAASTLLANTIFAYTIN